MACLAALVNPTLITKLAVSPERQNVFIPKAKGKDFLKIILSRDNLYLPTMREREKGEKGVACSPH